MKLSLSLLLVLILFSCESQKEKERSDYKTQFELSNGEETATYEETINFYIKLAKEFPQINILTIGETDSGFPLHLVTYNLDGDLISKKFKKQKSLYL